MVNCDRRLSIILNKIRYFVVMMKESTKNIIVDDLGISSEDIRNMPWKELDKIAMRNKGQPFRPENFFEVSGNIHLASNETMGLTAVKIHSFFRGVRYKIKCLTMHKGVN